MPDPSRPSTPSSFRELTAWLYGYLKPARRMLAGLVVLSWTSAGLRLLIALLMAPAADLVLNDGKALQAAASINLDRIAGLLGSWIEPRPGASVLPIVALICGIALFIRLVLAAAGILAAHVQARVRFGAEHRLRLDLYRALLDLPLASPRRMESGKAQARLLNDAHIATGGFDRVALTLTSAPLLILAYGIPIVATSLPVTGVFLCGFLLQVGLSWGLSRGVMPRVEAMLEGWSRLNVHALESLRNARLIRATASEERRASAFAEISEQQLEDATRLERWRSLNPALQGLLSATIGMGVLLVVAWEFLAGRVGLVGCGLLLYLGNAIASPLRQITSLGPHLGRVLTAARRVHELLAEAPPPAPLSGQPVSAFTDALILEGVEFAYEGSSWRLGPIDLTLKRGELLLILGASGSGKSTLLDLLLGMQRPSTGTITLDGAPLETLRTDAYRRLFGVVPQDTEVFTATLRENIAWYRPGASDAEVAAAAALASLTPIVDRLPEGYDTPLAHEGKMLSGGERQRVALARALLPRPELLLLDEATSALDPITEAAIGEALQVEERTVVAVGHRAGLLLQADRVLVLDDGQVLDAGSPAELLERCARYRQLIGRDPP